MSTTLQNVYYERKVGTARACYICNRPTQTVLATLKAEDYVYTCDSHLSDRGFVTPIAATGPSADDIRKVISEYNAREARRNEKKDGEKKAEEEKKEAGKDEGGSKTMFSSLASAAASAASSAASAAVSSLSAKDSGSTEGATSGSAGGSPAGSGPPSPPPMAGVPNVRGQTHKKYALHRTFFESRRAQLRSEENTARAKEVSKGLPQVPRGF